MPASVVDSVKLQLRIRWVDAQQLVHQAESTLVAVSLAARAVEEDEELLSSDEKSKKKREHEGLIMSEAVSLFDKLPRSEQERMKLAAQNSNQVASEFKQRAIEQARRREEDQEALRQRQQQDNEASSTWELSEEESALPTGAMSHTATKTTTRTTKQVVRQMPTQTKRTTSVEDASHPPNCTCYCTIL